MFATMKRAFSENVANISPRERLLAAAFIVVLAGYLALTAFDLSVQTASQAAETRDQLSSARAQLVDPGRSFPEARFRQQVLAARGLGFTAQTIPIARVQAQSAIENLANVAGMLNPRVQPEGAVVGVGELKLQSFSLRSTFDWSSFIALLESMSRLPQSIVVDSVAVDAGPSPTLEMRLRVVLVEDVSKALEQ